MTQTCGKSDPARAHIPMKFRIAHIKGPEDVHMVIPLIQ